MGGYTLDLENSLALRAREGDADALNQLIEIYTPIIEMLAKDMHNRNNPKANLQESIDVGKSCFFIAINTYNNGKPFESHMKIEVIRGIAEVLAR